MRSFSTKLFVLFFPLALMLPGCETIPNIPNFDFQKILSIGPGSVSSADCYQLVGGGNLRSVISVSCGQGGYLFTESLQSGIKNRSGQYELNRVADEYQLALNNYPTGNTQFKIRTVVPEGDVLIDLRIFTAKYISGTQIQCRSFFEQISVNGMVRSNENRSVCRQIPDKWKMLIG